MSRTQAVGIRVKAQPSRPTIAEAPLPESEPARAVAHPPRRVGVLGGTFDPPHIGHLWLATLAADELALDRVLFVPAAQPPHKRRRRMTPAAHRLLMTRLAIAADPLFELSLRNGSPPQIAVLLGPRRDNSKAAASASGHVAASGSVNH